MDMDYTKRGYLLPSGCKDLIDVLNLQRRKDPGVWKLPKVFQSKTAKGEGTSFAWTTALGKFAGEIPIPELISAGELAELLHQKLDAVIADLMQLGIFATSNQHVSFEMAVKVARKYGYVARRKT
jgi:hypothetical protein